MNVSVTFVLIVSTVEGYGNRMCYCYLVFRSILSVITGSITISRLKCDVDTSNFQISTWNSSFSCFGVWSSLRPLTTLWENCRRYYLCLHLLFNWTIVFGKYDWVKRVSCKTSLNPVDSNSERTPRIYQWTFRSSRCRVDNEIPFWLQLPNLVQ